MEHAGYRSADSSWVEVNPKMLVLGRWCTDGCVKRTLCIFPALKLNQKLKLVKNAMESTYNPQEDGFVGYQLLASQSLTQTSLAKSFQLVINSTAADTQQPRS